VIDKTGTLTHGDIEIARTETYTDYNETLCLKIAAGLEANANHPIAKAFKAHFDSSIQIVDVKNVIGSGLEGTFEGQQVKIGNSRYVLGKSGNQSNCVYMAIDGVHTASFHYRDPIRKETADFIKQIRSANIKVTLLTGDSDINASLVASEVGIDDVVANASPEDKLNFLKSLGDNDITMMVGDGINDAPTLAGAHLSVAMGGGTDVAKASADLVLLGDRLDKLLKARELALKTRKIIRENLAWSLGYNILILPLAVAGLVAPYIAVVGMSASSIIVVSNSLRLLKEEK
jgi:Cu2+-exporting ATPase